MKCTFSFPTPLTKTRITLRKAIGDIIDIPRFYHDKIDVNEKIELLNHDVYIGSFGMKFEDVIEG